MEKTDEALLSKKELAATLGKSLRWIDLKVKAGMPVAERHGRPRYRLSDVQAWLATAVGSRPTPGRIASLEQDVADLAGRVSQLETKQGSKR